MADARLAAVCRLTVISAREFWFDFRVDTLWNHVTAHGAREVWNAQPVVRKCVNAADKCFKPVQQTQATNQLYGAQPQNTQHIPLMLWNPEGSQLSAASTSPVLVLRHCFFKTLLIQFPIYTCVFRFLQFAPKKPCVHFNPSPSTAIRPFELIHKNYTTVTERIKTLEREHTDIYIQLQFQQIC